MSKLQPWIITAKENTNIQALAKKVTETGFKINQVLAVIGCIAGKADEQTVEKLKGFEEILDISPDYPVSIGPPDSPVTW